MPEFIVELLVKDPSIDKWPDVYLTEPFPWDIDEPLLPGPVSGRVAVLDFDENGGLRPGAAFRQPTRLVKEFDVGPRPVAGEPLNPNFLQASVFGTVYKTLKMFELPDALGRKVGWAFGAPQLLVVPAAGEWANAFYERDSHSLQFFYVSGPGGRIYTSHSQDIVSHETAHAIIDGVAPDLYDTLSPQALALHEALADMSALIMAISSKQLRKKVLARSGGRIDDVSAFSGIAEQFAKALQDGESRGYLRDLRNTKILGKPGQGARLAGGEPVSRSEPHALSEVLSGALYDMLLQLHEKWKEKQDASNALLTAAERLKRMMLRGLDYLPPGEVSFADFGRAMLAADQASHEGPAEQQEWLRQILVARGIVERAEDLEVRVDPDVPSVRSLNLDDLLTSEWIAYDFANRNRNLLGIPERETFVVRPRLKVTKRYFSGHHNREGTREVTECLFKVSWSQLEDNAACPDLARKRRITVGSTLVIDWETRAVRALLTGVPESEQASRDELLSSLLATGSLRFEDEVSSASGKSLSTAVLGQIAGGTLRVKGTARMLHVCGGGGRIG